MKTSTKVIIICIWIVSIAIVLVSLISCSAEKRCTKHFNKALAGGCITSDTITHYDTIVGLKTDTIFKAINTNSIDTFIIDTGGIKVVTITNWKNKLIQQKIIQKDTILIRKNVTINAPKHIQKWHERWQNIAFICGVICFILLIAFTQNKYPR